MYAIFSGSTGLFYAGVVFDNGTYGSGYPFHTFSRKNLRIYDSVEAAQKDLDQICKDPTYLREVPPDYQKEKLGEFRVVCLSISG